ncbi:PCI domain-containing protein [Mycena indigotica]|uniref:PCI domain-containing protein n=1 Tax=Mycena indigotica TaxID=2126181 RepID=A0A8H6S893_9AGAR|nr:PCI domain-containing protein [Mycena indigotica]KAF7293607.1 PCI domain-containing protein [Mycena indigotica]
MAERILSLLHREHGLDAACIVLHPAGPERLGGMMCADLHGPPNSTEQNECKMEAARVVARAFSNCMTDRVSPPEESRKWGVYYIVGLVMKCYFKVKWISLTKNIIKALENTNDIPELADYPRAHQVTYRYYIGMLAFLDEEFSKAEQELTLAFYQCTTKAHKNQTRILTYLIPLRILRGHLPSQDLLGRFPILADLFLPFISAIRVGDLAAFDSALAAREAKLIDLNLLLTIEKACELCMRVVSRRVWLLEKKSTRMHLRLFHAGLLVSGWDVDVEEAECLVANMIYKGFIRGYISHEK